jgi:putative FmdB family regulatory protein
MEEDQMPLRDLECLECGHDYEALIRKQEDLDEEQCPRCESKKLALKLSYPSNYTISGDNSASIRPKRMGGGK